MRRILTWKRILFLVLLLGAISPTLRCGGGAPPASIPAPVSNLMTISPPDSTGAVTISGQPGAVNPGATVQAANVSQGGVFSLWDLLIPPAYAQTFSVNTIADNQGAFSLLIDGNSGDTISVRQEVNGDPSPPTNLVVP